MDFVPYIRKFVQKYNGAKINISVAAKFNKALNPQELMDDYAHLKCRHPFECYKSTNIVEEIIIPMYIAILRRIDEFEGENLFELSFGNSR